MTIELNNTPDKIPQGYYAIKNWHKFQHYKHRNPPWIKLHQEILSSEDWVMLDDASKLLAVVCMVIAAKHNGLIPAIPAYIKRVAYLDKLPNLKPLIECGFLINPQADARESKQLRTNADTETETETETETDIDILVDSEPKEEKRTSDEEQDFERFWKSYPKRKGSNPKHLAKVKFISAVHKGMLALDLVAAADAYAEEQRALGKAGTEFVAQAATWLNQQRYMDYQKSNGDGVRAPPGLNPEQKKAWVQEEMRKFRESEDHV